MTLTLGGGGAGELVDVLDDDGRVVGVATRAEVRAGNLWHRTVFVAAMTPDDEVVVHRRADWKDVWPSYWDLCFGGLVNAGEPWADAAVRELAEEAGVVVGAEDLELLGEARFDHEQVRERCRIFRVVTPGPFVPADGEVVALELVPRAELAGWCRAHELVPDSVEVVLPILLDA